MPITISEVRRAIADTPAHGEVHVQIEAIQRKEGSNGKPFWELKLRDAADAMTLRVWSDSPNFPRCETLAAGHCIAVEGEFYSNGSFGLDARRWELRRLEPGERELLFSGNAAERAAVETDFGFLRETMGQFREPRLRVLAERFLEIYGDRMKRAAAARVHHHARRGGLVAHTAQMMRTAVGIADAYPALNRDLLLAGVLFHDIGKLWETCPPEEGFVISHEVTGELMGHISIGVEVINALWRELPRDEWTGLLPSSESVRLHLIHLVLSHHGSLEFGSPVEPKTPEALALHFIDNLDARLEMIFAGYANAAEVAPGIHDRIRPLNINPVAQLAEFAPPAADGHLASEVKGQGSQG